MRKRILFIVPSMVGGGVERCLLNLIHSMDQDKYDVSILAIKSGGELVDEIPAWVHYRYIWKKEWRVFGKRIPGSDRLFSLIFRTLSARNLCRIFVRGTYDVGVDYWGQEGLKLLIGMDKNITKLVFIHFDMNAEGLQKAFFPFHNHQELKEAYASVKYIVSVSDACRQSMIDRFEFPQDSKQLQVRYNINLNEEIIAKGAAKIPNQFYGDDFRGKTMCAVGRLTQIKGFDRLIKICHRLKEDSIEFRLWILGQGEEKQRLEMLIEEYALGEQVRLLGFQSNPYAFMTNADLLVCSSFFEGFSTVVSEAVILGVPVVATDCTGAKEILGESEYGIVCGKEDDSLYEALKRILTDDSVYQNYVKAVRERKPFFDRQLRLRQIEELFE